MNKTNSNLKKKLEKLNLEVKHALPGEYWKKMHQARLSREEKLQAKNEEFAAMIVQLRDAQKAKADSLFKAIQTEVNDTYLVGQRYLSDVIGIRKEYTENLTATLFEAREKMRVLEIEMNCKYAPILEEFEEEMKKMRNQVPKERQERARPAVDQLQRDGQTSVQRRGEFPRGRQNFQKPRRIRRRQRGRESVFRLLPSAHFGGTGKGNRRVRRISTHGYHLLQEASAREFPIVGRFAFFHKTAQPFGLYEESSAGRERIAEKVEVRRTGSRK
ncbi:unnamed protein product [Nesidiocoris tenuis]|uniref:Uncharacterized protein n=1 Tax=Nesidiocoris tenuis TaxID=355587 RepID=A0A6H5GNA5_9HEMI|nr:unnamed protein product [Nesidiocoris tenuis]